MIIQIPSFSAMYLMTLSSLFGPMIVVAWLLISSVAFWTATAVAAILNMLTSLRLSPNTTRSSRLKLVYSRSSFIACDLQAFWS